MARSLARERAADAVLRAVSAAAYSRRRAHVRNDRRWRLTDAQRFAVVIAVAVSLFLSAMSWGMEGPELVLVAAVILVVAGLGVFLLGLRYTSLAPVQTTAQVLTVSKPPLRNNIVGRCEMRLHVEVDGVARIVKVRVRGVPAAQVAAPGNGSPGRGVAPQSSAAADPVGRRAGGSSRPDDAGRDGGGVCPALLHRLRRSARHRPTNRPTDRPGMSRRQRAAAAQRTPPRR